MSIESTCFDNGMSGKCDPECSVFQSGECENPEEFTSSDIINTVGSDTAIEIMLLYPELQKEAHNIKSKSAI